MKRLDYLDNIAGILICYMMLMHILLCDDSAVSVPHVAL